MLSTQTGTQIQAASTVLGGFLKRILTLALTLSLLCYLPAASIAQKKKTPPKRRSTTETTPKPASALDMRAEAQQVAEQIKNVSKFLFVYGKVVNGLELADDQAKDGQVSPQIAAQNKKSKDAVVANITGLRAGIETVANNFKANSRLQVQYLKISYAAEAAANAERLATAGRYDDAGKALTLVIERLTETIMALRLL